MAWEGRGVSPSDVAKLMHVRRHHFVDVNMIGSPFCLTNSGIPGSENASEGKLNWEW